MKKKNNRQIEIDVINYGLYEEWDRESMSLPLFKELTSTIKASVGVEFGMIVEIKKARGRYLDFRIDHPPFRNEDGQVEPSFRDTFRVKHNPYKFFLGDTIWEPVDDKLGKWILSIYEDEHLLVQKTLVVTS